MSNILVTGGLGLIGHNVVDRLQHMGHRVAITDIRTNYGIIPQDEIDYLMTERLKKIQPGSIHAIDIQNYMAELCGQAFKAAWQIKATLRNG